MNKIAFVSFEQHYYDRHQFYCLSAYLKSKGFKVLYISETKFDKAINRLKAEKPDLLGYSTYSTNSKTYIDFDRLQKNIIGIKSAIGGPGAIFNPELFLNTTIDATCVGEGEDALVQYLQSDGKSANNMIINGNSSAVQLNPLLELDKMPFPDREIVYTDDPYLKEMKYRMFLSGRGCPYSCTYCHNHIFNNRFKNCGRLVRKKSVNYFIEELRRVNEIYRPNLIIMQDDTFIIDKEWLFEFCEKYRKVINKPFSCNVRPNLVNEEIVKSLKEAGCICCVWSIESGNDFIRNTVLKRYITKEQIINTAELLNKHGIKHRVGSLIGVPHETYDNIKETVELNIKCRPTVAFANTLLPFPGLDITDYAIKAGYLDSNYIGYLPNVISSMSILNFPREDKIKYLKTVYLFPLFVKIPILYRNLPLRKALYKIPTVLMRYIYSLIEMYELASLYSFGATFVDIVSIVPKYLKYSIWRKGKSFKNRVKHRQKVEA